MAPKTADLTTELRDLGMVPMGEDLPVSKVGGEELSISEMRRRRLSPKEDEVGILTLLEDDGVLSWEEGPVIPPALRTLGRAYRGGPAGGNVVTQLKFSKNLGTSRIAKELEDLDRKLTPCGPASLRRWTSEGGLQPTDHAPAAGKVLLFVHGTFSNSDKFMKEFDETPQGKGFLAAAENHYKGILAFDHFTVSRSPYLNAIELNRFFCESTAQVDVICHSRGGLVARWWTDYIDRPDRVRKVILVGCPLQGTSLADPTSLREGLNFLTNIGHVLGTGASLIPFFAVAGGLVRVLSSVGAFVSKSPLVDAALALMPGISAMSRVENNFELASLNYASVSARPTEYYAILSDFEPEDFDRWKFWKIFSNRTVNDLVNDRLVFQQPNDLIVDTSSMSYHVFGPDPDLASSQICRFVPKEHVHHSSYFRNRKALEFMGARLGLP